jgi:ankyrin repeat protein
VNVENNYGMTPLIRAIKDHNISLLEELLNCDRINVNYQTKYGETALMKAVMNEEIECVKLLLSHKNIDVNFKNNDGETALFYFSKGDSKRKGQMTIFNLLIEKGANPYILNNNGQCILHNFIIEKNLNFISYLLSLEDIRKKLCNIVDSKNNTAAMYSCALKDPKITSQIIEHSNIHIVNDIGKDVLYYAATQGLYDVVYQLIERGV